jgi:hypothetical protein
MAHLACRRLGDRVSVSREDDQASIIDNGQFIRLSLSLGIVFLLLVKNRLAISTIVDESLSSLLLSTAIYQRLHDVSSRQPSTCPVSEA